MSDMNGEEFESVLLRPGVDRILESMSHRYRRLILLLLKAETIETTDNVMARGTSKLETSEIPLTHTHLPKLEDAGYLEWDRDTGEISKGPRFDEIEPLLELIENHADELPSDWL